MASLFYPTTCYYKDFWSAPGATFEQRAPNYINCETTKTTINNIFGAIVIILIAVVMMFIPVDRWWYRPVVAGVGILLLLGVVVGIFMARHNATVHVSQIRGEFETWKLGQPAKMQNLGEYSRYRAPLDVQLESARIISKPNQQGPNNAYMTGIGSFAGTLAANYMNKK